MQCFGMVYPISEDTHQRLRGVSSIVGDVEEDEDETDLASAPVKMTDPTDRLWLSGVEEKSGIPTAAELFGNLSFLDFRENVSNKPETSFESCSSDLAMNDVGCDLESVQNIYAVHSTYEQDEQGRAKLLHKDTDEERPPDTRSEQPANHLAAENICIATGSGKPGTPPQREVEAAAHNAQQFGSVQSSLHSGQIYASEIDSSTYHDRTGVSVSPKTLQEPADYLHTDFGGADSSSSTIKSSDFPPASLETGLAECHKVSSSNSECSFSANCPASDVCDSRHCGLLPQGCTSASECCSPACGPQLAGLDVSLLAPLFEHIPKLTRVNLDVSTMISMVSNLCHGFCHFTFKEAIITQQAQWEQNSPLVPKLKDFMNGRSYISTAPS